MILNFKRCSVSGLSLDRIFLSFTGSAAYALFNVGLYWIPELQVVNVIVWIQSVIHRCINTFQIYQKSYNSVCCSLESTKGVLCNKF